MGDFTNILNAIPEFTAPAKRESYVDNHGLEIVVLTPLDSSLGAASVYLSSVELHSTHGPIRIQFPIAADTLDAAIAGWQAAAKAAILKAGEEMKANQRRIVLPGNAPAGNQHPLKMAS